MNFSSDSSINEREFSPNEPIFPNLSQAEELRVLMARIAQLQQNETMESSNASFDVLGQDGNVSAEQFNAILERIGELEKQQKNEEKQQMTLKMAAENANDDEKVISALVGQIKQLQNDQQKQLERISELEKHSGQHQLDDRILKPQTDQQPTELCAKISELEINTNLLFDKISDQFLEFGNFIPNFKFSNPQSNCWDDNACHKNLQIFGSDCLIIHYKETESACVSVFAKYSVPFSKIGVFYFEVKIINLKNSAKIGLSTKAMAFCENAEAPPNSYVYRSEGEFWSYCTSKKEMPKYSRDDVIGCGVNLASGRIIFTKNGQPLDTADLFVCPSALSPLFPCVSMADSGDLIEANFGPNFKFNSANDENTKQRNCWDSAVCHNELTISGPNNLIAECKGSKNGWRSVFAKHSILHDAAIDSIDFFYFEAKVENMKSCAFVGFADKNQTSLEKLIPSNTCTYAYGWSGTCWVDRSIKRSGENFADGDTVGCGVNLANQQLIFTKNGRRLGATNSLLLSSSVPADSLFPFVSLADYGDKISANFGPNFMFDLATL